MVCILQCSSHLDSKDNLFEKPLHEFIERVNLNEKDDDLNLVVDSLRFQNNEFNKLSIIITLGYKMENYR